MSSQPTNTPVIQPLAPMLAGAKAKPVPYYKASKVTRDAWLSAPFHIWILHVDFTKNNTLIVHKWRCERDRKSCFRAAARQLQNYRGKTIKEARFYVNSPGGGIWGYYRWVNGELLFTGEAEFMNRL